MTRIVFLLVPGLHLLDLAGPAQAFRTAADLGCGSELRYVAEQEDVRTAQGVTVRAETTWPSLTADDLIIVPGWRSPMIAGTGALSAAALGRLAGHHADGGTVVSICAGADALGRAGLLDGRRCTTHHLIQDELAARYPGATVIRDVLYVVDGEEDVAHHGGPRIAGGQLVLDVVMGGAAPAVEQPGPAEGLRAGADTGHGAAPGVVVAQPLPDPRAEVGRHRQGGATPAGDQHQVLGVQLRPDRLGPQRHPLGAGDERLRRDIAQGVVVAEVGGGGEHLSGPGEVQ